MYTKLYPSFLSRENDFRNGRKIKRLVIKKLTQLTYFSPRFSQSSRNFSIIKKIKEKKTQVKYKESKLISDDTLYFCSFVFEKQWNDYSISHRYAGARRRFSRLSPGKNFNTLLFSSLDDDAWTRGERESKYFLIFGFEKNETAKNENQNNTELVKNTEVFPLLLFFRKKFNWNLIWSVKMWLCARKKISRFSFSRRWKFNPYSTHIINKF